jgi:haloalkane dehalogenase
MTNDAPDPRDVDWVDRTAYPFESRFLDLPEGTIHYVDEGPTDSELTLLFLHGNPTWSFLYRHLIRGLRDGYRCVALDHLGFGLSEHPEAFSYVPSDHASVLEAFVGTLGLADVVPVVHDWGGPIGFSYAVDHPGDVRGVVAMNTLCWPVSGDPWFEAFSRVAGDPPGRVACERLNAFVEYVMPLAYADHSRLTPAIHEQYRRPLPPGRRRATWVFPRAFRTEREWLADLWARMPAIDDHPTLLAWGMEDPLFRERELRRFERLFGDSRTLELRGVGHYVPEEAGPSLVGPVRRFLADLG